MSVSGYQLLDLTGRLKDVNTGLGDLCRGFEIANAPGADAKTFTLRETGYIMRRLNMVQKRRQ